MIFPKSGSPGLSCLFSPHCGARVGIHPSVVPVPEVVGSNPVYPMARRYQGLQKRETKRIITTALMGQSSRSACLPLANATFLLVKELFPFLLPPVESCGTDWVTVGKWLLRAGFARSTAFCLGVCALFAVLKPSPCLRSTASLQGAHLGDVLLQKAVPSSKLHHLCGVMRQLWTCGELLGSLPHPGRKGQHPRASHSHLHTSHPH